MSYRKRLVRIIAAIAIVAGAWAAKEYLGIDLGRGGAPAGQGKTDAPMATPTPAPPRTATPTRRAADDAKIVEAFAAQRSGFMVESSGTVAKILRDDTDDSPHQRFILRLASGHTVLVAHNIDLAPRVPVREGDSIGFHGQYEWGEEGGVIHWTHHDPAGRHEEGWLEHEGKRYR
ncbi:MAG: DUF3465 domain-containing protein [Planctomycetes bacterium]|nr:DUF3465 domain-containing protein [Planctomycetota bacterium]